jgi:hypothetical protein
VIFPSDAQSLYWELSGPGSYTLVSGSGDKTILGISIQQSGTASESDVKCGSDIFVRNYGKDYPFNLINKICKSDIVLEKTGNDKASFVLTYVPRDLSKTQTATASMQFVEFGNNALLGFNGLTWIIYIGLGIMILLTGIRLGFLFMQK